MLQCIHGLLGHLTTYLHISNKLAERGHMISFLMQRNTISKLEHFNLHPDLISFIPITIPHIDGLPLGSETTPIIEDTLRKLRPHMVFFDFTYWLPALACQLGIKALHYCTISPSLTEDDQIYPPPSFPPSAIRLQPHEARGLSPATLKGVFGRTSFARSTNLYLEEKWVTWPRGFKLKTVIFCAYGSQCILKSNQFKELLLGFELTGMPFLAALKPPKWRKFLLSHGLENSCG
ncbi:UDP-glycosyltransferase superfamily protein, putative [Medicago truncatula]|uniref:UDP-glycosyltransferase superfamily protein, putative n=1 Tax=Medicago truncatula TaxID=3880 RepID=G7IFH8_MEDTR|nr:UDP-glycosyltransferase superfamily protein, putative [Medicago truncatula]